MIRALLGLFGLAPATDEEIIAAFDAWTLACAAGCEGGSLGRAMPLNYWLRNSVPNWMPGVRRRLPGVSEERILAALRRFVAKNRWLDYREVLEVESAKRGEVIAEPSEST